MGFALALLIVNGWFSVSSVMHMNADDFSVEAWLKYVAKDYSSEEESVLLQNWCDVDLAASRTPEIVVPFIISVLERDDSLLIERHLCDGPISTLVDRFDEDLILRMIESQPPTPGRQKFFDIMRA